jgi:hypothetical protein
MVRVPFNILLRDSVLLLATLGLWVLSRHIEPRPSLAATAIDLAAGVMTAVIGFLLHEWGHLIGCWLGRSVVYLPDSITSVFLFKYDLVKNSRRQFMAMAYGGFVASALIVPALLLLLSFEHFADRVALVLVTLGVIATFVFEVPQAWRVYHGGAYPGGTIVFVREQTPP